MIQKDRIS